MFARLASIALLALPILASATPYRRAENDSCSSGVLTCCDSLADPSSPDVAEALGPLGEIIGSSGLGGLLSNILNPVDSITSQVGLNCNPIAGNASCPAPVCCPSGGLLGGVVSLGCTPAGSSTPVSTNSIL